MLPRKHTDRKGNSHHNNLPVTCAPFDTLLPMVRMQRADQQALGQKMLFMTRLACHKTSCLRIGPSDNRNNVRPSMPTDRKRPAHAQYKEFTLNH